MAVSRRQFLKIALAAPVVVGLSAYGLLGDTYYMFPGEVLKEAHAHSWGRIVMANDCSVIDCFLPEAELVVDGDCCFVTGNYFGRLSFEGGIPNRFLG